MTHWYSKLLNISCEIKYFSSNDFFSSLSMLREKKNHWRPAQNINY